MIGDFLCSIPVMTALAKRGGGGDICVHDSVRAIADLIAPSCRIGFSQHRRQHHAVLHYLSLYDGQAYQLAHDVGLHMTQAMYSMFDLPIPDKPERPKLKVKDEWTATYDFVLSPFSVSLQDDPIQLLPQAQWQRIVDMQPDKKFGVFGSRTDPLNYIVGDNVWNEYDNEWNTVCNIMQRAREGLISVVTGTSHLAYALGVKNYLFDWQNTPWGINPDAVRIHKPCETATASDFLAVYG
jgi:hypothetical protein